MKDIKIVYPLIFILSIFNLTLQQNNFNIPEEYISDSSFISMTNKSPVSVKTLYASPKGSGSMCTNTKPCSLSKGLENLNKGYTLYLKGGVYDVQSGVSIEISGTNKLYILISAAPNEKVYITSSKTGSFALFEINASYIIIENLIFQNVVAKDVQGIAFYDGGQNHVIIRNNIFQSINTTKIDEDYGANAILLLGESDKGIKQVTIYKNTLRHNKVGYSEVISVAGNCQEIYVLDNYLESNTNIGIDFYGNAKYCKTPSLDQPRKSVAINNIIKKSVSTYAECAGLYVDGARDIYLAGNTVTNSQYGIEIGSEEKNDKYPVKNIIVKNNKLESNLITGIRVGGYEKQSTGVVKDCKFLDNTITKTEKGVIISKAENILFDGNKMTDIDKYFIDMEFSSSYTKNIKIENNVFSGTGKFRLYGESKLSLEEFVKKYPSNSKK